MTTEENKIPAKRKLESSYGAYLTDDAFDFAAKLLQENLQLLEDVSVLELVESACRRWKANHDSDTEERNLDRDEYYLDRAFCEATEMRKHQSSFAYRELFLPRVELELSDITNKWELFKSKWNSTVLFESEKRVDLLRQLRDAVLQRTISEDNDNKTDHLVKLLLDTIPSAFKEKRLVGQSDIVQEASSRTGLPIKYFQSPRTALKNLEWRLSKKLIGMDDVIHRIVSGLSKQESSNKAPFGSFCLLGCYGCGRTKLAEALAEELFDDKDRLIKLDVSKYQDPDCLIAALSRDKRPGQVVMLDNIENAHSWCDEVVMKILKDGSVSDEYGGVCVDFSSDILLVSSHVGHRFWYCRCYRDIFPKIPFQTILKDPTILHPRMHLDPEKDFPHCNMHSFYVKVAQRFKVEFLDLFDSVVVFPPLKPLDCLAITWLQVRETAATCMTSSSLSPVILFPSDAALNLIIASVPYYHGIGAHAYESWYEDHRDRMLNSDMLKNGTDKTTIIYIDILLGYGTKECCFRYETTRHLEKHLEFKSLKSSIWLVRSKYRQAKQQVDKIYRLVELIHTRSKETVELIDHVLRSENKMQVDDFVDYDKCYSSIEKAARRSNKWLELVSRKLQISLKKLQDTATQVVIEALLSQLGGQSSTSNRPLSFLCVGLKLSSVEQFAKGLAKHLVIGGNGNNNKFLFQVDLSLCTGPDSFSWCAVTDFVRKNPHSVIVFFELEKAHISVFTNILYILEDGVSKDRDGNILDFSKSVIVIITHLGDPELIGGLNGRHPCYFLMPTTSTSSLSKAAICKQEEEGLRVRGGLRSELLDGLGHMLLFDPFSDEQLNAFAKLSMKSLREKNNCLSRAFHKLFDSNDKTLQRGRWSFYTTKDLVESIKDAGGAIVRYKCGDIRGRRRSSWCRCITEIISSLVESRNNN